jgi:hypothetical protein
MPPHEWVVAVAISGTAVLCVVVETAAAQHAVAAFDYFPSAKIRIFSKLQAFFYGNCRYVLFFVVSLWRKIVFLN